MSELNENSLDRHFVSQLRMMCDVYSNKISKSDFMISQRWLQLFHKAGKRDKYARNCLMLLMYGQLREMGKLSMPFTKMDNANRQLEEVLSDYQGRLEDEEEEEEKEQQQKQLEPLQLQELPATEAKQEPLPEPLPLALPELQLDVQDNEDAASALTTNLSSYSNSTHRFMPRAPELERLESGGPSVSYAPDPSFELLTQQNQALIREINLMHARTLENEQRFRQADSSWQQRMPQMAQMELPKPRAPPLLPRLERGMLLAMRRLRDWTAASGPLNFLHICLQDMLDDEPETRKQLFELDRRLETVLDNMLEQAGERREKNVRMLYDQLFKQQQEALQSKQQLLRHEQRALIQARQQLQAHVQDLKQREQIFWEQQAAASASRPYYTSDSRQPPPGSPRTSSSYQAKQMPPYEELLRSAKTQTIRNAADSSGTGSGTCGCSECQAELEHLAPSTASTSVQRSRQAMTTEIYEKRTCQYCQPHETEQLKEKFLKSTPDDELSSKC
ncbi:transcription factor SPT20 homolog [Drosophila montana]|uniref:transcription factor SPT20 homolog n=1 Tax=Drosophila montana TaxID=40370 RepID=UPI00313BCE2E